MTDWVRYHQKEWYNHQIQLLKNDAKYYEDIGYPEIAAEIEKQITELEKKRDEVPK